MKMIIASKRVVSAIDAATSSFFTLITGAVAAIIELPQIALPQATSIIEFLQDP
nr:exported hypothetical protein [Bartonella sp. AR 15-3]